MRASSIQWCSIIAAIAVASFAASISVAADFEVGPLYKKEGEMGFSLVVGPSKNGVPWEALVNPNDFRLIQDAVLTSVRAASAESFGGSDKRMALAICVDTSRSISKQLFASVLRELVELVDRQPAGTEIALVAFGDDVSTLGSFSRVRLVDRLRGLTASGNRTLFFEALDEALHLLVQTPDLPARKRLLVVSDGIDDGSRKELEAETIIDLAQSSGVAIDSIELESRQHREAVPGMTSLEYLAARTNGFVFRPSVESGARFQSDLQSDLESWDNAILRRSLVLTFLYEPTRDGALTRELGVRYELDGQHFEGHMKGKIAVAAATIQETSSQGGAFDGIRAWLDVNQLLTLVIGLAMIVLAAAGLYSLWRRNKGLQVGSGRVEQPPGSAESQAYPDWPEESVYEGDELAGSELATGSARRSATTVPSGGTLQTPRPDRPSAILRGVSGAAVGMEFPVDKSPFLIGAAGTNDLFLGHDDYVSSSHALLEYSRGGLYLRDENSLNGTFVNNRRLGTAAEPVRHGDQLRFGETVFELVLSE
jgi:hypothetical protein